MLARHGSIFVSISTALTGASGAYPWSRLHSLVADVDDLTTSHFSLLDSLLGEVTLHGFSMCGLFVFHY